MKRICLLFVLLATAISVDASPLIFKAQKTLADLTQAELGRFDAFKYRSIRIGVKTDYQGRGSAQSKENAEVELNAAKRELERKKEVLEKGVISRAEFDLAVKRRDQAQVAYNNSLFPAVVIVGIEGDEEIVLASTEDIQKNQSFVIDNPPPKIVVKVFGKGKYSLYVWGQ